jgi:hypothetical protein
MNAYAGFPVDRGHCGVRPLTAEARRRQSSIFAHFVAGRKGVNRKNVRRVTLHTFWMRSANRSRAPADIALVWMEDRK